MELRKRKWKCRYVEEYLAVGEAPEQVRNCFQQRSRWAKVRASSGSCFWKFTKVFQCGPVWSSAEFVFLPRKSTS